MKTLLLSVAVVALHAAMAETVVWKLPEGTVSRDFCRVTADGKPVDVFALPKPQAEWTAPGHDQPYCAAFFDADREVTVEVEFLGEADPAKVEILPRSSGVKPCPSGGKKVSFRATPPFNLAVEATGSQRALIVCANTPEVAVPSKDDPKVQWIGPGLHRRDLTVGSGETLYLAPGAVVEGALSVKGDDVTVRGRGILSGIPWKWKEGPAKNAWTFCGKRLRIRDLAFAGAWRWGLVIDRAGDVRIDNVKVLGGKVLNDDGIDVCRSHDVVIRDSFIRSQDDCIAPKWWCGNLLVENCILWTDRANAVRIGWECSTKGGKFANLVFRDIDILRLSVDKRPASHEWANCAFQVQASAETAIRDVVFDTVRFADAEKGDVMLNAATGTCGPYKGGGTIDGLTLRRISVEGDGTERMTVRLAACDAQHPVKGVVFEEVEGVGGTEFVNAAAPAVRRGRDLFNGRDLSGWYTWLKGRGRNVDPAGVIAVTNGVIRVSGAEFGALVSEESFSDYRLVVEYRWTGGPQASWKAKAAPDSGILFHSVGEDGVFQGTWLNSHEYNLIRGASGDVWTVGPDPKKATFEYYVKGETSGIRIPGYAPDHPFPVYGCGGGEVTLRGNDRICRLDIARDWTDTLDVKGACNERPMGEWNTAELVCDGDRVSMFFNSKLVNRLSKVCPARGKIQLQSEGCGIEFRRVTLYPLK